MSSDHVCIFHLCHKTLVFSLWHSLWNAEIITIEVDIIIINLDIKNTEKEFYWCEISKFADVRVISS